MDGIYNGGNVNHAGCWGDVILAQQDIDELREFPDASVTTMWGIDLHYPDKENSKHFPGAGIQGNGCA